MNRQISTWAIAFACLFSSSLFAQTQIKFAPIDHPGADANTEIVGIDAGRLVGHYFVPGQLDHGFFYDGSGFTDLDYPPGPGIGQTFPTGIDGDSVVGYYLTGPLGFQFDLSGSGFSMLTHPGGNNVQPEGTDGIRVVGYHYHPITGVPSGFIYDGNSWTDLNFSGAAFTNVTGVEGQIVVGYYTPPGDFVPHGFLHELGSDTWTTLDFPGALTTIIWDIDDGRLAGEYGTEERGFGFFYDRGNWRGIDIAGSLTARVTGIDGDQIAGGYFDTPTRMRGFIASISDLILLGDINLDGAVTLLDISPFIGLLATGSFQLEGDINQDGDVDLLDIAPFVSLLTGQP